jgi:uncharacterized membrane protein
MTTQALVEAMERRLQERRSTIPEIIEEEKTFGQAAADWVAARMGSWQFIIIQSMLLACWIVLNVTAWVQRWDPYPFILMNLVLSMQAAYAAPIIMMSQNRQASRDRMEAHNDFLMDCKAEEEVRQIMDHLENQDHMLREILVRLEAVQVNSNEMAADAEADVRPRPAPGNAAE